MKQYVLKRPLAAGLALLLVLPLLSGCWNRRELNDIAVAVAMGIDRVDDNYRVSVQIVDPSQMTNNSNVDRFPIRVFTEKAPTVFEALRKVTSKTSRKIYLAHLLLLLFDERMAREGIKEPLDFLIRDHEVRPDFHIAITRGYETSDVLSVVTPMEMLSAVDLYRSLGMSQKSWAPTVATNVKEMMGTLMIDGIEPVLTGLTLIGDLNKGKSADNVKQPQPFMYFKFTGIGVFREDRLVGWLKDADSKSYSYVNNQVSSSVSSIKCPESDDMFAVEIIDAKVGRKPSVNNGRPSMQLKAEISANVGEVHCRMEMNDKSIVALQTAASEQLKHVIEDGIHHVQSKYSVDIYGFGENFHHTYPKQWRQWKDGWDELFAQMPVEVKMNFRLKKVGKIISPIDNNPSQEKE